MWISLCLLISSLAFLLGQGVLFWLSFMILDVNVAFLLSLFVLPGVTYYYLRKTVMVEEEGRIVSWSDKIFVSLIIEHRTVLFYVLVQVVLVFTLICNFFVGFIFKYRKLDFFPPPVFVAPLSVGLMAAFSPSALQNKPRFAYIFASSGSTFIWYTVFGFIIGSLNFPYFIWTVVYCMLSAVDFQVKLFDLIFFNEIVLLPFQIKLGAMWTDGTGTYSNQIITITLYIMAGFLLNTVFTTSDSE